jgi:hypothetical protein
MLNVSIEIAGIVHQTSHCPVKRGVEGGDLGETIEGAGGGVDHVLQSPVRPLSSSSYHLSLFRISFLCCEIFFVGTTA